ncbi:hypothetical protein B484DRAFT_484608 [Ochromonadaceae sp. CCMP2298]|nr:hypothetical protein B484DRAFT_484608 [Ochromonadaceae sp. CCMP2298]
MQTSLFPIFTAVCARSKDIFLYISQKMYAHLVPIVGKADQRILFKTSHNTPHTIYGWSYRHGRAAPCLGALRTFRLSVPYTPKLHRWAWTEQQQGDYTARVAGGETVPFIARHSDIIRKPLLEAGYNEGQIFQVVINRRDTVNRLKLAKEGGREEAGAGAGAGAGARTRRKRANWTAEQTEALLQAVRELGPSWGQIKKGGFPALEGRSEVNLKDKHRSLMKKACKV